MSDALSKRGLAPILRFEKYKQIREQRFEKSIESRLQDLANIVENLVDAPYTGLLMGGDSAGEALEELAVKEIALHWIVGIAKHSEGSAREELWSHIERAVTDLEKIAKSVLQIELPATPDHSDREA